MKTVRIGQKDIYIKDIIIAVLIAILPFLFYLYKLAPETQTWDLGVFIIDSGILYSMSYYIWNIFCKLLIIIFLILWFITCKNWWRNVIIIPVSIEIFKLLTLLNENIDKMDEVEYLKSLPITIPILILLIIISKKLNYYSYSLSLSKELNIEIDKLFNEIKIKDIELDKLKFELYEIRKKRLEINEKEYLDSLVMLRKKIFDI